MTTPGLYGMHYPIVWYSNLPPELQISNLVKSLAWCWYGPCHGGIVSVCITQNFIIILSNTTAVCRISVLFTGLLYVPIYTVLQCSVHYNRPCLYCEALKATFVLAICLYLHDWQCIRKTWERMRT